MSERLRIAIKASGERQKAEAKLAEVQAEGQAMRQMIESMIQAKGRKYAEGEMPPLSHAEHPTEPCGVCLKRNQMCIHNSVIEDMEAAIAGTHASAYAERVNALEAVARAAAEVRLHDWYRTSIRLKDALAKLKEVPNA